MRLREWWPPSKDPMHTLPHSVPPALQQATADPCLCWRLLDTHRQVLISLLWGHCSFLLGPGVHKVLFVPSKSLFRQPSVSSGGSVVGLRWHPPRGLMPHQGLLHAEPFPCSRPLLTHTSTGDTQTQFWLSLCGVVGSWYATKFVWALQVSLAGIGFDSECDFTPPTTLFGLLLCPLMWGIFFWLDPTFSCQWLSSSEL